MYKVSRHKKYISKIIYVICQDILKEQHPW